MSKKKQKTVTAINITVSDPGKIKIETEPPPDRYIYI